MMNTGKLAGRTIFITGASRGIGKAIALKAARDGANIVIAAKTAQPHPKLPGTIYTAAKEVEEMGGQCLPCVVDVRDEKQVAAAVENAVTTFGGIDILVNNASAISLTGTLDTEMKRYDLMHNINTRGTFIVTKACLPYLLRSDNGHVLNISPPLNMHPFWFSDHVAYTIAKYGMSMCVLGMAQEFKDRGLAVNALWPKTAIMTAAVEMLSGKESVRQSRKPEIMADAAYAILCRDSRSTTGQFFVDEDVLRGEGFTKEQLHDYAVDPAYKDNLRPDIFLDVEERIAFNERMKRSNGSVPEIDTRAETTFALIAQCLNKELVQSTQALFRFDITGGIGETWFIDLKNGSGTVRKGELDTVPDATFCMDENNFHQIFSGEAQHAHELNGFFHVPGHLKTSAALANRKLKITGNMQKAMKLEKILHSLKSKL